jgi:sugar phosphate isomerase/epimerase
LVDLDVVERYVARAAERVADLGARLVVFGSGGARNVPEGYPREHAWEDLIRFCRLCAAHFGPRGLTLAIEPLNHAESNILNTYTEGVRLAQAVDRGPVKVLADIYHFEMDGEPLSDILEAPEWLAHVHLADSGRLYPGSGSYPLPELFRLLHDIGYQGSASIECRWGENLTEESASALAYLRALA